MRQAGAGGDLGGCGLFRVLAVTEDHPLALRAAPAASQRRRVQRGSVAGVSLGDSLQTDGAAWEGRVRWCEREKGPLCAAAG